MAHFADNSDDEATEGLEDIKDLSTAELKAVVNSLQDEVKHFKQENAIFENFLNANEATLIIDMQNVLQKAHAIHKTNRSCSRLQAQMPTFMDSDTTLKSTRTFKSITQPSEMITTTCKGPRVNISQKTDLVLREIEDIQISYEKFIKKSKKTKFILRAEIEELDVRLKELHEAFEAFEKAIEIQSAIDITRKIPAEKFVRYMQEWLKNAQIVLEKLRLHTISFKFQLTKLKTQRTQKLELGESVDVADLEQMQIQKTRMINEIRQKNANLHELKQMNSKANMLLINHKKLLEKQHEKKNEIQTTLEDLQKKIQVLIDDSEVAEEEVERARRRWTELKKITDQYEAPPVMEYINRKAELYDLKRELKIWRRRQQVQDVGLATYTKMMLKLMGARKARESWYGSRTQVNDSGLNMHWPIGYYEDAEDENDDDDEGEDDEDCNFS